MQTSSPICTPRPRGARVSFGLHEVPITPLKKDRPVNKRLTSVFNEEDDERERSERRRSAALQKSISEIPPSTPNIQNDSMRGLSEDDLKSQLCTFSKLYCENRINVKNAWNIRVIDVLRQIVSKGKPDVLKVAGSSLNIAGKVYGLRVDDLHTEGIKLASSLARKFASKEQGNNDDENMDVDNQTEEGSNKKKRSAKKKRVYAPGSKKLTVAADPKAFLGDIPRLESASFSARTDPSLSNTDNLFTNRVKMDPAGYKFMLGSEELAWGWTKGNDALVNSKQTTKYPINIPAVKNLKLCPIFSDFQLDMWDPDKEHQTRLTLEEVVLDEDGIPIPELDGSVHDVFADNNDDVDDMVVEEEVHEAANHIQTEVPNIVDFRPTECIIEAATERTDYSFNPLVSDGHQVIDQIWAGPAHWKLKFIRNNKLVFSGRKEDPNEKGKKKSTKKKKPEPDQPLDLRMLMEEDVRPRVSKKKTKVHRVCDQEKFLLPTTSIFARKVIENSDALMINPNIKLTSKKKGDSEVDYQVTDYNYRNPNDSLYCPGADDNDNDDGGVDHFDDAGGFDSQTNMMPPMEFMCDNLVEAPDMVDQNFMTFATRAKKMDMKKLKEAVWCTLTENTEYDLSAKVVPTKFSKVYDALPRLLNETMKADLSCHLAFVALLHLCNEQNLKLERYDDISDFGIAGP